MPESRTSRSAFCVPDLNRSRRWYAELFRWQEVITGEDAASGFMVRAMSGGFLLGLRQPSANSRDHSDRRRTGLDHAALAVASLPGAERLGTAPRGLPGCATASPPSSTPTPGARASSTAPEADSRTPSLRRPYDRLDRGAAPGDSGGKRQLAPPQAGRTRLHRRDPRSWQPSGTMVALHCRRILRRVRRAMGASPD